MSPSGDIIALLSETHFAIFKHKSLEFIGDLSQGKVGSGQLEKKKTCAIKTIALNQEYLFAAADSRILVFAIDAVSRGTLCHVCDIGAEKTIDKFVMSSDGSRLLVLAKISMAFQFAQMYSASLELDQFTKHFVPTDNINWNNCKRIHRNGTFSADGNKIAIYTSHCRQGNVEIRFLQKMGHRWRQYREPLIAKVLSDDADAQLGEKGITGLAMYYFLKPLLRSCQIEYIINTWHGRWIRRSKIHIRGAILTISRHPQANFHLADPELESLR